MAIPTNRDIRLPLFRLAVAQSGEGDVRLADAIRHLAEEFQLTEEERKRRGGQTNSPVFYMRVAYARKDLILMNFIKSTGNGVFRITKEGMQFETNTPEASKHTDLENLLKLSRKLQREEKNR